MYGSILLVIEKLEKRIEALENGQSDILKLISKIVDTLSKNIDNVNKLKGELNATSKDRGI